MKKPKLSPLIVLTSLFLIFLTAFFILRNTRQDPVLVSRISAAQTVSLQEVRSDDPFPININQATAQELAGLPGIGETLAQRIIEYRQLHGRFHSEDQLLNVEGIGSGKLSAILDLITLGGK